MATKKYRVKEGHRVHHGRPGQKPRLHEAGEHVELEDEEAAAMPWAIEPAGKADGK